MERARRQIILFIFAGLSGLMAGTVIPELFRMGTGAYSGLLSLYSLEKYENSAVSAARLFPYIVTVRLPVLVFLWMSCYTTAGLLFHLGYAWWLAVSAGMLLSLFVIRDGYSGVVLFGCCLFPQWILYAAMWRQELAVLLRKSGRAVECLPCDVSAVKSSELVGLARMAALCLAGCAAEAFLGIWTLKIYLQFFT